MRSDLIVVADRTSGLSSPIQQLMLRLVLDRQILWVDADLFRRGVTWRRCHATPIADKLPFPVLDASALGVDQSSLAPCVGASTLSRRIIAAAGRLGLKRPILWLASSAAHGLAKSFSGQGLVYHHAPTPRDCESAIDPRPDAAATALARAADLVLAPTLESVPCFARDKARLLPNGVDLELFATPTQRALEMPWDRPVAGFHGHINEDFDTELVAAAAHLLPNWQFMLIGPVSTDVASLAAMDNVMLLGARSHEELPRFSQYWAAAILPRRAGAPVRQHPPLQLAEYLAAGLPVISAGEQVVCDYADLITPVRAAPELATALVSTLEQPLSSRASRRARMVGYSWSIRAAFVHRLLDKIEARQGPPGCGKQSATALI
jgi:glycosyltransferase involved in cell wall biosynthesis